MAVLRPHLVDGVPLTRVAADAGIPIRTARRWIARYRADGPAGLVRPPRPEAGKRTFPKELVELIEGMALLKPPPSIATIHRRIAGLASERGWRAPSYGSVRSIVGGIDPAMATLAHEGAAAFRDKYELVHRHRAVRPNATWQADHTQLDILILDADGKEARPWLTTVLDDHSRAIAMGLVEPVTREDLRAAAEDGSIVSLLDWKRVKAGDFWYAPAGTIHAIGAGLSLLEIQQNVDVTYRLYDYGSGRQLHLDEAIEAASPVPYVAPFLPFDVAPGRRVLAADGPFVVERWSFACSGVLSPRQGEPVWLIPLRGEALVGSQPIGHGGVWIVTEQVDVSLPGSCELLVAYSGGNVHEQLIA